MEPRLRHGCRYVHIIVALAVPAVAVAVDALLRRWLLLTPFAVALLLVGVQATWTSAGTKPGRDEGSAVIGRSTSRSLRSPKRPGRTTGYGPIRVAAGELTLGWLRKGIADGRVPVPDKISPRVAADARFRLSLQLSVATRLLTDCSPVGKDQTLHLDEGQSVGVRNKIHVFDTTATGENQPPPLVFSAGSGRELLAYRGPLDLKVTSADNDQPAQLCTTILTRK